MFVFSPPLLSVGIKRETFPWIGCEFIEISHNDEYIKCKVCSNEFLLNTENYDIIMDNKVYYYGFDYTITTS